MNETNIKDKATICSSEIHEKVISAFTMQILRGQKELNGKLSDEDISKYCILDNSTNELLEKATQNFNLSFRSRNKVLKVSRTIADLENSVNIEKSHLMEALSYRRR